ncbi:hypothetical protein WAI453_009885 [Rhynchosporium graminicola]
MSSIYSSFASSSSSFHSDATADLPKPCNDIDCLYPYGSICDNCALDAEEHANRRAITDEWVEESQINRDIVLNAGEEFTGGADETDESESGIEDDEANEVSYEENSDSYLSNIRSEYIISSPYHLSPEQTSPTPSSISSIANCSSISIISAPEPELLASWLDTLFDHTHHGHATNVPFAGGADVEQDPNVDNCELCGRAIGEATDQHYLKCKYAHEERERVRKWGSAWNDAF